MEQHLANLFAGARSSWLTGNSDRKAVSTQGARQLFGLSALAAAIETFEGNKSSTRGHVGMIAGGNGLDACECRMPATAAVAADSRSGLIYSD